MATSTLIQRLDQSGLVTSTTVPGSYTVVTTPDVSNRTQKETFLAGAAITKGDWVAFDTSATGAVKVLTVIQASTSFALGNPLVVGVALNAATAAGERVEVCVSGYCDIANVAAAVAAAGVALVVDATLAGRAVAIAAADTANACGVSLAAASAGNVGEVWVYKQF
jgi:hypothetical protein